MILMLLNVGTYGGVGDCMCVYRFTCIGSSVSVLKKARVSVQKPDFAKFFASAQFNVEISGASELTKQLIGRKLLDSGGAHKVHTITRTEGLLSTHTTQRHERTNERMNDITRLPSRRSIDRSIHPSIQPSNDCHNDTAQQRTSRLHLSIRTSNIAVFTSLFSHSSFLLFPLLSTLFLSFLLFFIVVCTVCVCVCVWWYVANSLRVCRR